MAEVLPPGSAGSRRERRKREVRGRILDAAVGLFDAQGVDATKVAEICERADVAHKTFFNHFSSKGELLRQVAQEGLADLLVIVEAARRTPGPRAARVRRVLGRVARNLEQAGPTHRELLTEMIHVAHETGTEGEQARVLHEAFAGLLAEGGGRRRGERERAEVELVLGAFYALMFGWAHLDAYPVRRRAASVARLLETALASGEEA